MPGSWWRFLSCLTDRAARSRHGRHGPARRQRRHSLVGVECLERRDLLAAPVVAHPFFLAAPNSSSSPQGLTPAQIAHAYGVDVIKFGAIVGNGAGQTIAIVDAYDDPNLVSSTDPNFLTSDLHNFDVQFNLPDPPSFTKLAQDGSTNYPGVDTIDPKGDDWELEESLDVEWAHALAPLANIVLVEANDSTTANLQTIAVPLAASLPGVSVVSMSWGSPESSDETGGDSTFITPANHAGVTFVASTGDSGAPGEYPAVSPNVLAVGGTTLALNSNHTYQGETGWSTLPPARTVDNGALFNYSQTGTWTTQSGGFGGTYLTASPGSSTATWKFTGVSRTIPQDVSVTWVPGPSLATNATYEVFNNRTLLATVKVNQQLAPVGISSGGAVFQKLGDYTFTSGTIRVELLASGANGLVAADAAGESEGWGSGGGISQFESQPAYQNGVVTQSTTNRAVPDVSWDADPSSGVAVYDTYDFGSSTPWTAVGGTSLSAPSWAALLAIVNQGRVNAGKAVLDGPSQTLPMIYQLPATDFHDITTGYNGLSAGPGYDLVTGRGSPFANLVALDLAGVSGSLDYFAPSGSATNILTVTLNNGVIQILNNGTLVESRALAATTAVNLTGATGTTDLLTVDFTNGDPIPAGGLSFTGNAGDGDQLILSGAAASSTFLVTGTQVQHGTDAITYSGVSALSINTNAANDTIDVQSTASGVTTAITAGQGNDTVLVGSNGSTPGVLASILGPLTINGGSGTTTLTLDDSGNTATADTVTASAAQVGVPGDSFFGPGGSLTVANLASITLNMSNAAAGDTANLTPSASTSFTINGNSPATAPGDRLNLNLPGVTGAALTRTSSNSGQWTFANRQPVSFTGMETQNLLGFATHFSVSPASLTATTGSAFSFTVQALDSFNNIVTGYGGTVAFTSSDPAANLPGNSTLTNGTGTFTATLNTSGNQTLTATDTINTAITGSSSPIFTTGLTVTSFAPTPTGFTASFSKPFINSSTNPLHIYDAASASYGVADVTLVGVATGTVRGSLIINSTNTGFTFVKTNEGNNADTGVSSGLLAPDTYTVTLVSGPTAFQSTAGELLDGKDSVLNTGKSNNYITSFTVTASTAVVVSIPDFARGPAQPASPETQINLPNNPATPLGIPISLSNGNGVTDGTFVLSYDSTLLTISGNGTVNPSLADATFAVAYSGSGASSLATITFHSPTPLAAGAVQLGGLFAAVPSSAPYKAKELLHFTSVSLNNGGIAATGADGVHLVAFLDDASGDGLYTSLDAVLLSRVSAHADSGFAAFPVVDPVIVADTNADGAVTSGDGVLLNRYLAGSTVAQLPVYPGAPSNIPDGPDPSLSITTNLHATPGDSVSAPVNIDDPRPPGSTGMTQAILALTFDPAVLSVSAADIHLGSVPASGTGWVLQAVVDATTGQIGITLFSATPINSSSGGSLVTIDLHVNPGATIGPNAVQLVAAVNPNGQGVIRTAVDDNQGPLTLSPPAVAASSGSPAGDSSADAGAGIALAETLPRQMTGP